MLRGDWEDPDVQSSLDRRRKARPEYAWVAVTAPDGTVQRATDNFLVGQSVRERSWFLAGQAGVHVGDVHEAVLLAKLVDYQMADGDTMRFIDLAAPIRTDNTLVGVVAAHVHWDWVWQTALNTLDKHGLGDGLEMLVLGRDDEVLYPSRLAQYTGLVNSDVTAPYFIQEGEDGQTYLTSVVAVPPTASTGLDWHIVVRQPTEQALREERELQQLLLLLGFIAGGLIVLLAHRTATHIAEPIEQLTSAAQKIEAGEANPEFPRDLDIWEVENLSESLQSMTHTLRAHELELERKVQDRTEALEVANRELEQLASTDVLTGLHNRRRLLEKLNELLLESKRSQRNFAVLMLDIDHFKQINDSFGHEAGDKVLKEFAQILRSSTRATDFVARYGGEEFVVLLCDTQSSDAVVAIAEKILASVARFEFSIPRAVTTSIGVTQVNPGDSGDQILRRADGALYAAKTQGRNRVEKW